MHFSTTFLHCLYCAVLPEAVLVVRSVTFWVAQPVCKNEHIWFGIIQRESSVCSVSSGASSEVFRPQIDRALSSPVWAWCWPCFEQWGCAGNPWSLSTWWLYDLWLVFFSLVSEEHLLAMVTRSCWWRTRFTQLKFMKCVNRKENRCGFFMQTLMFVTLQMGKGSVKSDLSKKEKLMLSKPVANCIVRSRELTIHVTAASR